MTDQEFDLLDELYFVQHYSELKRQLSWEDDLLLRLLKNLYEKELIKCFRTPDDEVFQVDNLYLEGKTYYYLATKKGLMIHNSL
jgi:hypothetical protein